MCVQRNRGEKLSNLLCKISEMSIVVFAFGILSCLPLLYSATENNISMPICPETFSCPNLAPFKYPFYKATNSRCGLIEVNCSSNNETIQLGGQAYEIAGKSDSRPSVLIYNRTFENLVKDEPCEAFMNSFNSPNPLLFSISIAPFITIYKCTKNPNYAAEMEAYFHQPNYNNYNICKNHNFYYQYLVSNATVPKDLPHRCEVIQLPVKTRWQFGAQAPDETNISSLISPYFTISFNLTPPCDKCHRKGGRCHTTNGHFQCLDANKEKPSRELIRVLVIVGAAFILMLFFIIFIIWCRHKNNPFSYFSSTEKSPEVEDGSLFCGVSVFSYTELEDATQNFNPSCELGNGGSGAVYYGKLRDGREVAVKRLYESNYKRVQHFMNEIEILARLRHPNLVLLYGCTSRQSRERLLVYEYIPNGTVADHLHGEEANAISLAWPIRMNIAIETASALVYLHASEIIHRDVKTNNILLDHNFCVKVADFGLSRLIPNDVTHVSTAPQGTPGYLDPQYHQRYRLTDKSDVYSYGVVLIELISSMVAVDISRSQDEISLANLALNRIKRCAIDELIDPNLGSDSDDEIKRMITSVAELAFRCLQFDSEMRPTMNEVLDELMEIQADRRIYASDNIRDLKTVNPQPPSETIDAVVLLKDFPPSPVSVTSEWKSDYSASTTPSTIGDRFPMNNRTST